MEMRKSLAAYAEGNIHTLVLLQIVQLYEDKSLRTQKRKRALGQKSHYRSDDHIAPSRETTTFCAMRRSESQYAAGGSVGKLPVVCNVRLFPQCGKELLLKVSSDATGDFTVSVYFTQSPRS